MLAFSRHEAISRCGSRAPRRAWARFSSILVAPRPDIPGSSSVRVRRLRSAAPARNIATRHQRTPSGKVSWFAPRRARKKRIRAFAEFLMVEDAGADVAGRGSTSCSPPPSKSDARQDARAALRFSPRNLAGPVHLDGQPPIVTSPTCRCFCPRSTSTTSRSSPSSGGAVRGWKRPFIHARGPNCTTTGTGDPRFEAAPDAFGVFARVVMTSMQSVSGAGRIAGLCSSLDVLRQCRSL